MQVLTAPSLTLFQRLAILRSALVATLLIAAGLSIAIACLTTPLITSLVPAGRPSSAQVLVGILGIAFAFVVPGAFLVMGVATAADVVDAVRGSRPRRALPALASVLGSDHVAAADLVLPDGRRIHELVAGPFGVAVLGDTPPASITRMHGQSWELRDGRGRWIPMEAPVERATRDAERVRRWLGSHDRDFVIKVYAAVVTEDERVVRSPACAVVAPRDLAEWLGNLPPQRGLTPSRRESLETLLRELMATARRR